MDVQRGVHVTQREDGRQPRAEETALGRKEPADTLPSPFYPLCSHSQCGPPSRQPEQTPTGAQGSRPHC